MVEKEHRITKYLFSQKLKTKKEKKKIKTLPNMHDF